MSESFESIWKSSFERLQDPNILEPQYPVAKFGIRFLDAALDGLYASDVILLGAKTGAGKTEMVSAIACQIAKQGKKVNLLALEADRDEIERRLYYRFFANEVFNSEDPKIRFNRNLLSYANWNRGDLKHIQLKIEIPEYFKNLYTSYRQDSGFSLENLHMHLLASGSKMDAIILDHVHYIDLDPEKENAELKKVIQLIREVALQLKKPIIVVAHLRKSQTKNESVVPDLDEFHGSSELSKICTRAILLAPCYDEDIAQQTNALFPTFIRIAKNRKNGSVCRYIGLVNFDLRTNSYNDEYRLGRLTSGKFEPLEHAATPDWAVGA